MASVSGLNSAGLNFTGLASGIDSTKLIDGLTALNQQRIDELKARQATITQKQATFAALQGKLFDLQTQVGRLARSAGGAFDGRTASSSDDTAVAAAAGTAAAPGTYTVTVEALAQAQQVASQGFADPGAALKQGTLTVRVGGGDAVTVTLDSRNNTLRGLADAINAAGADVRAAVVNDGSATPYRLLLTATKTGAANAITVTNNLTAGDGAAIDPAAATVQAAADARVTVGSGPGALTVRTATNQVSDLIPGVTLDLRRADPLKPVTLTVANDTGVAAKAVQDFVEAYNGVIDFIDKRDDFTAETGEAGVLLGSREAADIQNELAAALATAIPGVKAEANRLAAVGVTFDNKGRLQLDTAKLDRVLTGQVPGVSVADVKRLFATTGASDNPGVEFVLGADKTRPSGAVPYQVSVTAPATRAAVTGPSALAGTVTITAGNNSFTVKVNNVTSTTITLTAGDYTPQTLAQAIQLQINTNAALAGNPVAVDLDAGRLRITSQLYGAGSQLAFAGGTALGAGGPLGFAGTETAAGTNVAGQFVVSGQAEAATGVGQVLTGNAGNANTDGLQVRATLGAAGTANLTVTQGLASRLGAVFTKYLDPVNGRFKTIDNEFQQNTRDIDATVARQTATMDAKKELLLRQFAAMESAVSRLKGLGTQLSSLLGTPARS